ncbi:MAG: hypothetical protein IKE94_12685 [Aeriscardovia sp.]|nr:hypothetical protein [Aeriscardovia sp.]
MTLLELQNILGERIKIAMDETMKPQDRIKANEQSEIIARLAKQMINNADVVLRTNKLQDEGKVRNSQISKMVGE